MFMQLRNIPIILLNISITLEYYFNYIDEI